MIRMLIFMMRKKLRILFAGSFLFIAVAYAQQVTAQVTPETALRSYLDKEDDAYHWEIKDVIKVGPVTAYDILLTSQNWKGHIWKHQLTVVVPRKVRRETAMLFIDGGTVNDAGQPNWRDPKKNDILKAVGLAAWENRAVTAVLKQVPMQPLYGGKREDALISMTLHNYKEDNDHTWPLLFPMTKSAIKAMDAIQELATQEFRKPVKDFLVAGASKRGWTTWLTGASQDPRVKALAPIVIDIVNMPVNLNYQLEAYDEYSEEIQDYTDLGIPQAMDSESGRNIVTMIDPYSYRKVLTQPKMIFNGTNDPFWVVDAIKHYIDSIPGQNLLHYVPNAGHNLGDGKQAFRALTSFFGYIARDKPLPLVAWETEVEDGQVVVNIEAENKRLQRARVWYAYSDDRDFRDETWVSEELVLPRQSGTIISKVVLPTAGYKAFYIDLEYKDLKGNNYTQSTRVFVADVASIL